MDAEYIIQRIRQRAADLPLYNGGPGVDYTNAEESFAINIVLIHGAEVLLVKRGMGDGVIGSWSGVSGYVDCIWTTNPILYTIKTELLEECGLEDISDIEFSIGEMFVEQRKAGGLGYVIPIKGRCKQKPRISIDSKELTGCEWVWLSGIHKHANLSPGFLDRTLSGALGKSTKIDVEHSKMPDSSEQDFRNDLIRYVQDGTISQKFADETLELYLKNHV